MKFGSNFLCQRQEAAKQSLGMAGYALHQPLCTNAGLHNYPLRCVMSMSFIYKVGELYLVQTEAAGVVD